MGLHLSHAKQALRAVMGPQRCLASTKGINKINFKACCMLLFNIFWNILRTRRCRVREMFGGEKYFCPHFLKLARKACVRQRFPYKFSITKMVETFFQRSHSHIITSFFINKKRNDVWLQRKGLHFSYLEKKRQIQTYFVIAFTRTKLSNSSHNDNKSVETSVPEFFGILPRFLANQNLWGCVFTPASYTTDSSQCQKNQCLKRIPELIRNRKWFFSH